VIVGESHISSPIALGVCGRGALSAPAAVREGQALPYQLRYGVPSREVASEPLWTPTIPNPDWCGERGASSFFSRQDSFDPVQGSVGSLPKMLGAK